MAACPKGAHAPARPYGSATIRATSARQGEPRQKRTAILLAAFHSFINLDHLDAFGTTRARCQSGRASNAAAARPYFFVASRVVCFESAKWMAISPLNHSAYRN